MDVIPKHDIAVTPTLCVEDWFRGQPERLWRKRMMVVAGVVLVIEAGFGDVRYVSIVALMLYDASLALSILVNYTTIWVLHTQKTHEQL